MISALDSDSDGNAFLDLNYFVKESTEFIKLTTLCTYCNQIAAQTIALFNKTTQNVVGDLTQYAPVCYKHAKEYRRK